MSKIDDLRKEIDQLSVQYLDAQDKVEELFVQYLDAQDKVEFLAKELEVKRAEFKQLDFSNALTDGRITICKPSIRKETKQAKKKKPLTISDVERLAAKLGLSHILEGLTTKKG